MHSRIRYISASCLCGALLMLLSGCFTGVEGTGKITLSRDDRKLQAPTPEELLLAGIGESSSGEWQRGKPFMVSDAKINLILEGASGSPALAKGDTIRFLRIEGRREPDGRESACLAFTGPGGTFYILPTGKDLSEAPSSFTSRQIPLAVDIDMVEQAAALLRGRKVWILSPLWRTADGNPEKGMKYVAVDIRDIRPGDSSFPMLVEFSDKTGTLHLVPMNFQTTGPASRTFASLFSLTDIKERYPAITAPNWELIQKGLVTTGMTKEECRLSLGNPTEVNAGHDYSRTLEIWQYPDGTYLQFADGLLVNFRK